VTRLNAELVRILQLPDVKERFANLGVDTIPGPPAEFSNLIKSEYAKFAKLIKDVGVKIE
jgi:tripartite-type tricarboxylate transporter receptor subunit TctC